jgi:hypothetical protein
MQLGAAQVMDEARHVEFFTRALAALDREAAVSPHLVAFARDVAGTTSSDQAFLGVQMVLEVLAQSVFVEGARLAHRARGRAVSLPGHRQARALTHALGNYVGKDEARHVAFGVHYFRAKWRDLSPVEQIQFGERLDHWSALVDGVLMDMARPLRILGVDARTVAARVTRARRLHLAQAVRSS